MICYRQMFSIGVFESCILLLDVLFSFNTCFDINYPLIFERVKIILIYIVKHIAI
jgi:hypothetical protein